MQILKVIGTVMLLAAPGFAEPHAYPVPFTPSRNAAHTVITFTDLPGAGTVKIFTIEGRLVAERHLAPGQDIWDWPVTNTKGEKVATGVYIYLVDANGERTEGKLVVIR